MKHDYKKKKKQNLRYAVINSVGFNIKTGNVHAYNYYSINNCLGSTIIEEDLSWRNGTSKKVVVY